MEKCPWSCQITISLFYKREKKILSLVTIQLNYLVTVSHAPVKGVKPVTHYQRRLKSLWKYKTVV